MNTLIQIGGSKGVRIPKVLIEQAKLANTQIEFEVLPRGLLIKPVVNKPRQRWEGQIQQIQTQHT